MFRFIIFRVLYKNLLFSLHSIGSNLTGSVQGLPVSIKECISSRSPSAMANIVILCFLSFIFSQTTEKVNSTILLIISYWPFPKRKQKRIIEGTLHTENRFFSLIIFLCFLSVVIFAYGNFHKVPSKLE